MNQSGSSRCCICGQPFEEVVVVAGLRRSACAGCGHSERIDRETFDYVGESMGASGVDAARLRSQADFILPHIQPGARAIEIGCAGGHLAEELRGRRGFGGYDGVEFSPAAQQARGRLDNVWSKPVGELLKNRNVGAGAYDLALASHVLEHVENPGALVDDMGACLRESGMLFIEVPNRSGHPQVSYDDNRSHLHFFSVASISRLLVDRGFTILAMATGARFDARYPDSIRLIASRRRASPTVYFLSDRPALAGVGPVAIWGAGRMVEEMIAPHFDPARIAYFVDRDPAKWTQARLGRVVHSPDVLRGDRNRVVVVNSLEMEPAIREQIARNYGDLGLRVIGVAELLETPK